MTLPDNTAELPHADKHVKVVGAGLLGASVGIALMGQGIDVWLTDASPTAEALACDLGAGRHLSDAGDMTPDLVVVAVPPDVTAGIVARELTLHPAATVTDVASVKGHIRVALDATVEAGKLSATDLARYVGSHPMAGREKSGPIAARADLFAGRPWVICTTPQTAGADHDRIVELARRVGAAPVELDADEHDSAVARVSHVPQIMATLTASRLNDVPVESVALAGQGLRDVTRIAASDAALWTQILSANADRVREVLTEVRGELDTVIGALSGADGSLGVLAGTIVAGNDGQARIPGKHGAPPTNYATVTVLVGDSPGMLGRLFTDMGEAGINLEDLQLEHANGQQYGLAEVSVVPAERGPLIEELRARGWNVPE